MFCWFVNKNRAKVKKKKKETLGIEAMMDRLENGRRDP